MKIARFLEESLTPHREYWQARMEGELAPCGVPLDFPRPSICDMPVECVRCEAGGWVVQRLDAICGQNQSLLFTLLAATSKLCLRIYNGHEDIRIGTTIRKDDEEVSAYNRILVLRENVSGDLSFHEFTSR